MSLPGTLSSPDLKICGKASRLGHPAFIDMTIAAFPHAPVLAFARHLDPSMEAPKGSEKKMEARNRLKKAMYRAVSPGLIPFMVSAGRSVDVDAQKEVM